MRWSVNKDFGSILSTVAIAMFGIAGVIVGLIVRVMFFPTDFVLSQVFLSLENIGLLFGMFLFALVVFWVLDTYNWKIRALGNLLFLSILALLLIGAIILVSCTHTGEISLLSLDIPIPISISLISIPVLIYYCVLLLPLHLVWEEWCFELLAVCILLFAAIYTNNMTASLFALSFSLIIVATVRGYGKHYYTSCDVTIYRFGKPVRKRKLRFCIIPFIEEFRPEPEPLAAMKYYKETKEGGVIYIGETVKGVVKAIMTRGWKRNVYCHLVFTNKRLIVARKGLSGSSARMFYVIEAVTSQKEQEKSNEFKRLSPESILKSHKKNLGFLYSEIKVGENQRTGKLFIRAAKDVYEFKLEIKELENIENLIRSILPEMPIEKFDR